MPLVCGVHVKCAKHHRVFVQDALGAGGLTRVKASDIYHGGGLYACRGRV